MVAVIDGHLVQGTLEDITKLMGSKLDDSKRTIDNPNTYGTLEKCKNCPHNGEGCNPQFCL